MELCDKSLPGHLELALDLCTLRTVIETPRIVHSHSLLVTLQQDLGHAVHVIRGKPHTNLPLRIC